MLKSVIVKNDEGRESEPLDTLRRTLLPGMAGPSGLSQSNEARPSREGIPALISLHRYFNYQTTKRADSLELQQGSY
jgi:hypothetical protein